MDTAIVVVDPQKGWVNANTKPTLDLLARELQRNACWGSVVITKFMNDATSPFRSLLPWWKAFQTNEDTDLMDEFLQPTAKVFSRNIYGLPPNLWDYLDHQEVRQIVLTGVETDATIAKTAMDAFDRNISVVVPPHLVASTYGPPGQEHGLAIVRKVLGKDHILSESQTRELLAEC